MAPRFPNRLARVFFFSAESVCAVCERELVQAAQSAGVGRREGVSARGTVSDAGAVRCRAPQLQQASARQASASQMLLMRVAACRRRAVSSLLRRHRRRVRPRASKEPTWVDSEEMRRTHLRIRGAARRRTDSQQHAVRDIRLQRAHRRVSPHPPES